MTMTLIKEVKKLTFDQMTLKYEKSQIIEVYGNEERIQNNSI